MSATKIILGTVQLGMPYGINNMTGRPDREAAITILQAAQSKGIKILDTADAYGEAYDVINSFHENNPPFLLMTKFKFSEEQNDIDGAFALTRKKLNFDRLKTYSFHSFSDVEKLKNPEALLELKKSGQIEEIGISVYTDDEFLKCIEMSFIDVIQIPFNLLDGMQLKGDLFRAAKEKGKKIYVRSVYLQGLFFKKLLPEKLSFLLPYLDRMRELARECGLDMGEMALRYAMSFEKIEGVIIGLETLEQLEWNMKVVNKGPLPQELIKRIHQVKVLERDLLNPVNWK